MGWNFAYTFLHPAIPVVDILRVRSGHSDSFVAYLTHNFDVEKGMYHPPHAPNRQGTRIRIPHLLWIIVVLSLLQIGMIAKYRSDVSTSESFYRNIWMMVGRSYLQNYTSGYRRNTARIRNESLSDKFNHSDVWTLDGRSLEYSNVSSVLNDTMVHSNTDTEVNADLHIHNTLPDIETTWRNVTKPRLMLKNQDTVTQLHHPRVLDFMIGGVAKCGTSTMVSFICSYFV